MAVLVFCFAVYFAMAKKKITSNYLLKPTSSEAVGSISIEDNTYAIGLRKVYNTK